MLQCIIPPNFRLIPEIVIELERERRPSDLINKTSMENLKVLWNTQKLAEHDHF